MTAFCVRPQAKNPEKGKFTGSERKKYAENMDDSEDEEEDEVEEEEDWEKAFEGDKPYILSNSNYNRVK